MLNKSSVKYYIGSRQKKYVKICSTGTVFHTINVYICSCTLNLYCQHSVSIYCCIMIYLFLHLKTWTRCGQDFPYPKEIFLAHKKCGTLCATTLMIFMTKNVKSRHKSSQIISLRPPESTQFLLFFSIRRLTSCYFSTIVSDAIHEHRSVKEIKKRGNWCWPYLSTIIARGGGLFNIRLPLKCRAAATASSHWQYLLLYYDLLIYR
jgi:hypothetical protein